MPCVNHFHAQQQLVVLRSMWDHIFTMWYVTGGGHGDGTEYASAISQVSFRGVALAANDVAAVFQRDAPELSSLFLVWALQETERYACRASGLPAHTSLLLPPCEHARPINSQLSALPISLTHPYFANPFPPHLPPSAHTIPIATAYPSSP